MSLLLSSFYPSGRFAIFSADAVLISGNQNIDGVKRFLKRPFVNNSGVLLSGEDRVGNYHFNLDVNKQKQYLKQISDINSIPSGLNLKNNDIINIGFGDIIDTPVGSKAKTLKVNPGILIDQNPLISGSRNYLPFANSHPNYSGKAIQKIRYNSTIGNGYEKIILTNGASNTNVAPVIRPKTRRLETFYDIDVPPGGSTRYIVFQKPTSFPFVQGTCMNLRFNFLADSSPCTVNCVGPTGEFILSLTGSNYNFIQKERVILISKGDNGTVYEFKHW